MRQFHNVRGCIAGLAFSADGQTLMACVRDRMKVAVWNLETGAFHRWHAYADDPVSSLAFSPDGKWLAVGSQIGMVLPYKYPELDYDTEFHPGGIHSGSSVVCVAFGWSEDRSDCCLAMAAGNLSVAWMNSDEIDKPLPSGDGDGYTAARFSPDGRQLAALNVDNREVQLWDVWAKELSRGVEFPQVPHAVCFSADGRALAISFASRIEFLNADSLSERYTRALPRGQATHVAAHPAQNIVASAGGDGTVRFWNADSGQEEKAYGWNIGRVTAVAFAPDGLTCAAGGANGQVVVWDVDA